jgi:hypothetical protein
MGEGRIPFTAIDRYARRYGISEVDEFDRLKAVIRAMDAEYLNLRAPKTADDEPPKTEVSAMDVDGSRAVMERLKARTKR